MELDSLKYSLLRLFLCACFTALGCSHELFTQERNGNGDSKPDWVESMPVSMNGQLPQGSAWQAGWEREHWHDLFSNGKWIRSQWKASSFFDDPLVVELCDAIFERDVPKMKRLIAAGADVNKVGEDGMTPLYWAFHMDVDPRPFGLLLEHGANPNVIIHMGRRKEYVTNWCVGYAVVHLVVKGTYNRHFEHVFENGGDSNLKDDDEPFFGLPAFRYLNADAPDAVERLELMIRSGANLNERHENGTTFTVIHVGEKENGNRLALVALKAGANYELYYKQVKHFPDDPARFNGCYFRLIHYLAEAEPKVNERPATEQTHYRAVVDWLEEHGDSLEKAKADLVRWEKWKQNGRADLIEKEHQERLAKQAREKSSDNSGD